MNFRRVSMAVLAGSGNEQTRKFEGQRPETNGTAFCVAPDLFLTAAHVYDTARATADVALGRIDSENPQLQTVADAEVFPEFDLAVLRCPGLAAEIAPISFTPLGYLDEVFSPGYAFGIEVPNVYLRAFKGYVLTSRGLPDVLGLQGRPRGYEVSIVPPPGLSGAPLFASVPDAGVAIVGMMLTHYTAEYGDRRMELGLALDLVALRAIRSRLLGAVL